MSTERRSIDANSFEPDDLDGLTDDEYRAVVDADLRRRAPRGSGLRDDLVAALRTPEQALRWHSTLARMQRSVDGQLAARECDFRATAATIEKGILSATSADATDLHRRLEDLKVKYWEGRAATMRFKTGVDETLIEAKFLRDQAVEREFGSAVVAERDYLASRCRRLTAAIEEHHTSVLADLGGDEPDEIDLRLWSALRSPTEPNSLYREQYEANVGRDDGSRESGSDAERFRLVGTAETRR